MMLFTWAPLYIGLYTHVRILYVWYQRDWGYYEFDGLNRGKRGQNEKAVPGSLETRVNVKRLVTRCESSTSIVGRMREKENRTSSSMPVDSARITHQGSPPLSSPIQMSWGPIVHPKYHQPNHFSSVVCGGCSARSLFFRSGGVAACRVGELTLASYSSLPAHSRHRSVLFIRDATTTSWTFIIAYDAAINAVTINGEEVANKL